MRWLCGLSLVLLVACQDDVVDRHRLPPVLEHLERLDAQHATPHRIRFHRDVRPGQWALYDLAGARVLYRVEAAAETGWTVSRTVPLGAGDQAIQLLMEVDATGAVQAVTGRALRQGQADVERELPPPTAPKITTYRDGVDVDAEPVAGPSIAGLATTRIDGNGLRWWFAEGAYFSMDLRSPGPHGGLVQSAFGDRLNRRLVAQGDDDPPPYHKLAD